MGEKREEHLVPAFCNLFQYPIFWLILPGWTLDGLKWSHKASGNVYCETTSEKEDSGKPVGHCLLSWFS